MRHSPRCFSGDHRWPVGLEWEYVPAGVHRGTRPKATAVETQKLACLQESSIDGHSTPNGRTVCVATRVALWASTSPSPANSISSHALRGPQRPMGIARHGTAATGRMSALDPQKDHRSILERVGRSVGRAWPKNRARRV